ncbi:MAG: hypothetical protein NT051_04115 [Candidatus Micrarchaeota archaeon]|nr:hypothetical protein [Candidatus Micrarchaeota archaeon]
MMVLGRMNVFLNHNGGSGGTGDFSKKTGTDWQGKENSPQAWERLVAKRVDRIQAKVPADKSISNVLKTVSHTIPNDISEAASNGTIKLAIAQLELEADTAGLLVISGQCKGEDRDGALRALSHFATEDAIDSAEKNSVKLLAGDAYVPLSHYFDDVARIALSEKSVMLAESIFYPYDAKHGQGSKHPLISLFIEKEAWKTIVRVEHRLSKECIFSLAPYIADIAKASEKNSSQILETIGACHPDKATRLAAIDAIKNGAVDKGWVNNSLGCCVYKVEENAGAEFVETGRHAVDLISFSSVTDDLHPISKFHDACRTKNQPLRAYATQKLILLLDLTGNYEAHALLEKNDVRAAVVGHLEGKKGPAIANENNMGALEILAHGSTVYGMAALKRLTEILPVDTDFSFGHIAENAKDPEVRRFAGTIIAALSSEKAEKAD